MKQFESVPEIFLSRMLAGVTVLVGTASCGDSAGNDAPQEKWNFVYIMCDDHSYQTISCYDGRFVSTPNIDRIAQEGARFTNSFVTNSLSGPSRACLLTGKHSHKNGFTNNEHGVFDGTQQTLPKLLQAGGYQTAMVGKWHLVSEPTGFDHWDILTGQGDYYNPVFIRNGEQVVREGYATDLITAAALEWMDRRDPWKPFCLFLHHKAPHRSWMPDTQDLGIFDEVVYPLPETFYDDYAGREAAGLQEMSILADMNLIYDLKMADLENELHTPDNSALESYGRDLYRRDLPPDSLIPGRMNAVQQAAWDAYYNPIIRRFKEDHLSGRLSGKELYEWKYQRYMRDYCSVIHSVDRNVGRVYDYLEAHGLLDNTLIIYTSDQGFFMGEHGYFDKRFMYEESFRTPLLVRLPGGRRIGDIAGFVQNIDYAPTLLEMAGLDIPEDIQGESFLPLLRGRTPARWRKSLYYHYYEYPAEHAVRRHYGVRTARYSLMHFYNDIDEWELFDLKKDPQQLHNLYGQPGTKRVTARLRKELLRLQELYDDPVRSGKLF